jgi:hypothetical protein
LARKGYQVIGEFSCRIFTDYDKIFQLVGGVNKGRPNEKDVRNARHFAEALRGLCEDAGVSPLYVV